jgi:long-chain acyl-CoA synthetase
MTCLNTNVTDFLLEGKEPDRIALQLLNRSHSYGELETAANSVTSYLVELGCQTGDRVLLVSENSFFWVAAYLGILRAGLVAVPLSATILGEDLKYVLEVTSPQVALVQGRFAIKSGAQLAGTHVLTDCQTPNLSNVLSQTSFEQIPVIPSSAHIANNEASPDDLAALMFTSGSTGKPRGVMVSHRNIMANTESIIQYLGLTENDRIMTVLPFHYCFGTSLLHTHLRVGGSLVLDSRFLYPEAILQRMIDTECTGFAGVPSHFQILLRSSSLPKKHFSHLRYVQQAGGHLAPFFIRELREALPATQIFVMYGQTEATARLSYLPPEFLDTKFGSIGKGIPGVTLRVLNESGQEVRPGEVGEIVAEGENVTLGYWHAPHETASSFRDGKLYTGDMATLDEDGFIYVVDRAKDFVKCGGKRVACRQIEDQLLECDALLEAAVIGVPDGILGEAVKAFVVPRASNGNGLKESLQDFCKKHMSPQLIPKEIILLHALPKNSAGKVLKQNLRVM